MRRLNIGSGPYPKPDYVNIDVNRRWNPDVTRDVRKGLPYDNSSVDEIMATHFLEHLSQEEVIDFLGECYRVLKPDCTLFLGMPLGIAGPLEHKTFYTEHSFDTLLQPDAADYYRQDFRWELVSQTVEQDCPDWCEGTLLVVLRALK